MSQRWPAWAKLNLYLHVLGRRADGYHLLDSLVAFADIGDEIEVAAAPALRLDIVGRFAASLAEMPPRANLVWRAAERLAAYLGRSPAAAITLAKNLPIAAGIGGGSSDAAATLRALLAFWGTTLDEGTLATLASELGADVPACLAARSVWVGGIGEAIEPAQPLPPAAIVLVNPGIALPTAAVFKARRGAYSRPGRFSAPVRDAAGLAAVLAARRNDLTEAAVGFLPVIEEVLRRLALLDGALLSRMSGSGATCFALFASREDAAAAAARLAAERPEWWIAAGRLL